MSVDRPERIIGDKASDGEALDEDFGKRIELIAQHRGSRKPENVTQNGRPRYERRWKIKRTISSIQNRRRLCIRYK